MPGRLILISLLTLLCGCARLTNSGVDPAPEVLSLAPPLKVHRRIVQQIVAEWPKRRDTFICVLELDEHRIAIAGLSKDGLSLFNIAYDGNKVNKSRSPLLPAEVKPEHIIQDIQFAFWPQPELQKNLAASWRLAKVNKGREFFVNDDLIVSVQYFPPTLPTANFWPKSALLTNHRYHYRLTINTISNEALPQ